MIRFSILPFSIADAIPWLCQSPPLSEWLHVDHPFTQSPETMQAAVSSNPGLLPTQHADGRICRKQLGGTLAWTPQSSLDWHCH
jgi:hypothetical protein